MAPPNDENDESDEDDTNMQILSDEEFLAMVRDKGNPDEFNRAIIQLRREGRIQLFDDGSGDPLIITTEQTN